MTKIYSYGPLKSSYFSQFEKMWIEGFCRESKIELNESNLCNTLRAAAKTCPDPIKNKITSLLTEAEKFSCYSKDMFIKSWNNILGFTMNVVKPEGTISEGQVESLKVTNKWWLMEAPKIMANEMQFSYFKSLVVECLSVNGNALNDLKTFSPIKPSRITENAKKYFSYDKITMAFPPCRIDSREIKKNEAVLCMVPEPDKLIAMIAWCAESVVLLKTFNK